MARINLLPWREERREERRKRFLLALTGVVVGSIGAVFIADQVISAAIDRQIARNDYIGKQIAVVDERIKQISELKAHRQQLVDLRIGDRRFDAAKRRSAEQRRRLRADSSPFGRRL